MDHQKDQWIPAPLYSTVEEEEKVEVINSEIAEHTIEIYFGKNNYNKNQTYIYAVLRKYHY